MFGMHLAGGDRAAVAGMEGLRLAGAGHGDLAADHHDARVPVMRVVGVHLTGFQAAIEDLVTFAPQIGASNRLVHDKYSEWLMVLTALRVFGRPLPSPHPGA